MLYVIGFSEIQIKKVYFDKALDLLVKESEKLGEKMRISIDQMGISR